MDKDIINDKIEGVKMTFASIPEDIRFEAQLNAIGEDKTAELIGLGASLSISYIIQGLCERLGPSMALKCVCYALRDSILKTPDVEPARIAGIIERGLEMGPTG